MGTVRDALLGLTIFISFLFFTSINPAAAQESKPKPGKESKVVTDFCNQRPTSDDRAFCTRIFKSNPKSAKAKDNVSLLKIAIELAVGNAKKTREFLSDLEKNKATKPPLKPVLQECIAAYDNSILNLNFIDDDLQDDPPMASYDAWMANKELDRCQNSLNASKIPQDQIASRNKIAAAYGRLCEDIAKST